MLTPFSSAFRAPALRLPALFSLSFSFSLDFTLLLPLLLKLFLALLSFGLDFGLPLLFPLPSLLFLRFSLLTTSSSRFFFDKPLLLQLCLSDLLAFDTANLVFGSVFLFGLTTDPLLLGSGLLSDLCLSDRSHGRDDMIQVLIDQRIDIRLDVLVDVCPIDSAFDQRGRLSPLSRQEGGIAIDFCFGQLVERVLKGEACILRPRSGEL